ncbi:metalloprotease TldD [Albimonas sp. CAU 1670]|uniref:metalloprotease TldD n=1 Tax=Albimonas sp. CAU 1670 TaxID=3032599 RepID=UPI0023DCDE07|nr:metalloprotease TldD [Albimonas sp. CAU 1670]MDF2231458.1 metalloprotease TldD [Albimonas sp. CAU 1670]
MTRSSDPFRPFETALDEAEALAILREAVAGADDGELYLERRRSEALAFDDGRLRTASYDAGEGFGLRAVCGEAAGYAHSTELSSAALKRAAQTTRLAARDGGGTGPAAPPQATNRRLYSDDDPLEGPDFQSRVTLLSELDAYARAKEPKVAQVTVSLACSMQEIEILRPEGTRVTDARPLVRMNVSVICESGGRRESGSAGGGGRFGVEAVMDPGHGRRLVDEAIRQALVNLEAEDAPAGVMDVALSSGWPGILLHEAVGHGLEGDFNRKKTSAFAGLMGEMIAAPGVTVVDDGTIPDRRGSITVDDEGTPSARNVLIEDGRLVGYMQDRQNARLMGVDPTGNGRRQSYAHPPMPRMTNTIMLGGTASPEDVVAGVEDGIHAVAFGGGQVDITNGKFVFSCTEAYRVKNGKVLHPVKGATLIGDGATALKKIRAVGSDMALDPGMGMCGKAGQWVPVGVGQPTLLIGGLTVGGAKAG